ncbi:MAG TPA: hypothetical protein VN706_14910 [Gemmatimonadaceae bacterium]|nr:hypothetical protein [Gemmatimonadaceae bacterium]
MKRDRIDDEPLGLALARPLQPRLPLLQRVGHMPSFRLSEAAPRRLGEQFR